MIALKVLFWVIGLSSLLAGALFTVKSFISAEEGTGKPNILPAIMGLLVLAGLITVSKGFGEVPAGYRGVVTQFGAVTGKVLEPGLYAINPFTQDVQQMDVQVHAYKAAASAASLDMQNVTTEITLNYQLHPDKSAWMYNIMRRDYGNRIITPSVQEAVKAVTAQYKAEELITRRQMVRDGIEAVLGGRLARHGIIMDQMSITNFSFSPEFANAIEAKVVATQMALKAENEVREAKFQAEKAVAAARGQAEAIRIQAEAVKSQGGAEYVQLEAIKKWNGTVPQWVTNSGQVPFINLSKHP